MQVKDTYYLLKQTYGVCIEIILMGQTCDVL